MLLLSVAFAWDGIGAVWSDDAFPIPYEVTDDFGPLDDAAALAAVQAGFDTWAAVDCADIAFTYVGRTSGTDFQAADGHNRVLFYQEGWPEDASLVSAPGITTSGAEILDGDLALNAQSYAWSTDGDGRVEMDLQSAVTHEVGHLLGLWHSTVATATLNPANDGNPVARDLDPDDTEGICALYERGAVGTGAQGEACVETVDCTEGLLCVADGDTRYCTVPCDAGACPDGYECLDAGGSGEVCARTAETGGCGCGTTTGSGWWAAALGMAFLRVRRSIAR